MSVHMSIHMAITTCRDKDGSWPLVTTFFFEYNDVDDNRSMRQAGMPDDTSFIHIGNRRRRQQGHTSCESHIRGGHQQRNNGNARCAHGGTCNDMHGDAYDVLFCSAQCRTFGQERAAGWSRAESGTPTCHMSVGMRDMPLTQTLRPVCLLLTADFWCVRARKV